jgi:acetoacetyl-CoA synthetase
MKDDLTPLWQPSSESVAQANMTAFMKRLNLASYQDLYQFSINHCDRFWQEVWNFSHLIAHNTSDIVIENPGSMEDTKFFPDAKLNFAENLLRFRGNNIAIEFFGEDRVYKTLTFDELYEQAINLAQLLLSWGIQPGDRIGGFLPNLPETIVAMLATAAIGAIWSSCSPDFGVQGVVDRFGQIQPKVFLSADGYFYNGKRFDCLAKLPEICAAIPSIEKVIIIPYTQDSFTCPVQAILWSELYKIEISSEFTFPAFPFNHPLFILYSSGTTGVPKCIIHGAGGTLIQHLKEHQLHCDLKKGDKLFYFTTCGWMMWNWLVSGLATGATLILYDGSPGYPHFNVLFDIADRSGMTHFGTSAKYIDAIAKEGLRPKTTHKLTSLKMILSTGSPLSPESFDYVYTHIKSDVCLASISGGTDIISCFALGNPIGPVWRGELQTRGLGMKVDVFDENGKSIVGEKGELVCTAPFPSQPLGFWNDPKGEKYHQAYFARYPGIWHHGDFVELTSHDGIVIYGRSDAILNPGGVRIGTAEIYRQVEQIPEVLESIVVGQDWQNDIRIVLFVRLREGLKLTDDLIQAIKAQIRNHTTPRHVPAKIIQISDIPRTKSGKIAELAVRQVIHGEPVRNQEALANPNSLEFYKNLPDLQT